MDNVLQWSQNCNELEEGNHLLTVLSSDLFRTGWICLGRDETFLSFKLPSKMKRWSFRGKMLLTTCLSSICTFVEELFAVLLQHYTVCYSHNLRTLNLIYLYLNYCTLFAAWNPTFWNKMMYSLKLTRNFQPKWNHLRSHLLVTWLVSVALRSHLKITCLEHKPTYYITTTSKVAMTSSKDNSF